MYLCPKYLDHLSKWGAELGAWEVICFVVPEEIVYSLSIFFQTHFGIVYI